MAVFQSFLFHPGIQLFTAIENTKMRNAFFLESQAYTLKDLFFFIPHQHMEQCFVISEVGYEIVNSNIYILGVFTEKPYFKTIEM